MTSLFRKLPTTECRFSYQTSNYIWLLCNRCADNHNSLAELVFKFYVHIALKRSISSWRQPKQIGAFSLPAKSFITTHLSYNTIKCSWIGHKTIYMMQINSLDISISSSEKVVTLLHLSIWCRRIILITPQPLVLRLAPQVLVSLIDTATHCHE